MNSKVDKHIHEQLSELYEECRKVVEDYEYFRKALWTTDAKEYLINSIAEQVNYIEQAVEVFQNAELITNEERRLCNYCASRMQREAKTMLREHIRKESA